MRKKKKKVSYRAPLCSRSAELLVIKPFSAVLHSIQKCHKLVRTLGDTELRWWGRGATRFNEQYCTINLASSSVGGKAGCRY